jgi:long-subunit fatty acid transport protein
MIKKIIVSVCLLFSLVSFAQEGTSSPYSFYGIGDVRFRGTIENRSMAGLAIVPDSIHINLQNPAMYSSLKLTSFSVGGTFSANQLKTNQKDEKAQRTTLDYLAVGIPLKKLGLGFGLIPYSSVGYNIRNSVFLNENRNRTDNFYKGSGGLNKVFFGFGYQLAKNFSIGADVQYNFGKIDTRSLSTQFALNSSNVYEQVQYSTRETNSSTASGVNFNTGLSYNTKLYKSVSLFSSLTYSPEATITLNNERFIAIVQSANGILDTVDDEVEIQVANTKLKMPSKFSFGVGIGDTKKWIVGTELTFQGTSNFGNRFNDIDNVTYENATRFTVGGYYIPNYKSFTNYFERIVYRGGFRFENTGLVINNQPIEDAAVTLGLGLPLRGAFSNVNVGFELGNRGTQKGGLVREHYMNFSIGLSLNDRWFQKRKYD